MSAYEMPDFEYHNKIMGIAQEQAQASRSEGGVPVGAVLVKDRDVVSTGYNRRVQDDDPTAHGEIDCIRNAGRQKSYSDMALYTTLSPCKMCTGAILQFGIGQVIVGEKQNFGGNLPLLRDQGVRVTLLSNADCVQMMADFIDEHPGLWKEDIAA